MGSAEPGRRELTPPISWQGQRPQLSLAPRGSRDSDPGILFGAFNPLQPRAYGDSQGHASLKRGFSLFPPKHGDEQLDSRHSR